MKTLLRVAAFFGLVLTSDLSMAKDLWRAPGPDVEPSVVLMRHALAPGTGDPANFQIDDCRTQRNLSDEGRHQARQIGDLLRQSADRPVVVYSSQWCRCLETARLLDLGPVRELPFLNSFFQRPQNRQPQTRDLKEWISTIDASTLPVLVTHQVNITALTGVYPRSGEMVGVRLNKAGEIEVIRQAAFQ